jgi:hypothetical protein
MHEHMKKLHELGGLDFTSHSFLDFLEGIQKKDELEVKIKESYKVLVCNIPKRGRNK